MTVNDDGPADNVICGEALVIEGKPGITFVSKKGKQVACVVRMRFAGRIVVVPCFGEVIRAITVLVDVHGIKVCGVGFLFVGQIEDFGLMVSCKNDFFIAYAHKKISLPESVNLSFIWRGPAEGELPVIGMKKCFPV